MNSLDERQKILVVDDSKFNQELLMEILGENYQYILANDGLEAISILQKDWTIDLMLLDINMPRMNGFEVLEYMNQYHWIDEFPVIVISAEEENSIIEKAYNLGAAEYIQRPFDAFIIKRRVMNTLVLYANQKRLTNVVVNQVYEKEENNKVMIGILSSVVGTYNKESREHILHIRIATQMLLRRLVQKTDAYPLTESDITLIATASSLHDIGKVGISKEILNKPTKLTDEEYEIMKTHTLIGAKMIQDMDYPADKPLAKTAYEICRWHHERFDGKGYPDSLVGNDIPISAQVVSVADVFDALTSTRVYKKAYDYKTAIQMILDGRCGCFNPLLLDCLKEIGADIYVAFNNKLDYADYNEVHKLSGEILKSETLPYNDHSQRIIDFLQEKMEFFEMSNSKELFDYNPLIGELTIINREKNKKYKQTTLEFNSFDVNEEVVEKIKKYLNETSVENKEFTLQFKELNIKFHTLWSGLDEEQYIGVIGQIDRRR
jgi:putative two-component system response regulator